MPLLAGVYEAYAAASRVAEKGFVTWLVSFVDELATRMPLMLILAAVIFGIVTYDRCVAFAARRCILYGSSCAARGRISAFTKAGDISQIF
jgi:hypothetical protein